MTDLEKSRQFWERAILGIELSMFIGMALLLYFMSSTLASMGVDIGSVTGVGLQILFTIFIIYTNKNLMAELNRRIPIPK